MGGIAVTDRSDLRDARQRAERAWHEHVTWGRSRDVRDVVARSWRRSSAHVEPDRAEAPVIDEDRAVERWRTSPLRVAVDAAGDDLQRVVGGGDMIAAVTGADGTILWTSGSRHMRDRAAQVRFVRGGRWDEASMGTNAMAVTLATNRPSEVFAAEHYSRAIHDWVCWSAPVVDPASERLLGVVDLSTTWERAHPLALATATLLARTMSLLVPARAVEDVATGLTLRLLGRPRVLLDGRELSLPPRHVDILCVLSLHPDGLTLDRLHGALHEHGGVKAASVKADVSHLRRRLGSVIGSRPYRLTVPVTADHLDVLAHLRCGRLARAVGTYGGELLPSSDAPAVRDHARFVEAAVRQATIAERDPDLLFALGDRLPDDVPLHHRTLEALAADDPRRAIVHARLAAAHG